MVTVITPAGDRFNVTVTFADGTVEELEGLYDVDDCLSFSRMVNSYHYNRYK